MIETSIGDTEICREVAANGDDAEAPQAALIKRGIDPIWFECVEWKQYVLPLRASLET